MTSRRSRLKAVTNLPVRRKVPTVQGSTKDTAPVESLTSEKIISCHAKSDEILATAYNSHPNHIKEKNVYDVSSRHKGNDSLVKVNCTDFQRNENFANENDSDTGRDPDNSEILETNSEFTKNCNLLSCKADSNSSSVYNSDHYFKLNSVSSPLEEKSQLQTLENRTDNEILLQQSCTLNFNSSNNNDIVEDDLKCYTVLTPQNVTLSPLTEYTISSLVPCENNFIETSVNDINAPQDFEEVQIYTEAEASELFITNDIDDNSESIIVSEPLEPVLTTLTNYNSEPEVNSRNSDVIELQNNSENSVIKPVKKITYSKTSLSENNQQRKSSLTQIKDANTQEKISSSAVKAPPDYHSYRQMSTVRRKRVEYNDYTKKLADAKKEFQKKYEKSKPDRSSLKMIDLIFYNPSSNPMESKAKFDKKDTFAPSSDFVNDLLAEEKVDEPETLDSNSRSNMCDTSESESTNKMPVPQVKIGLDGEIILDEKSLVIETTDAKKGREGLQNSVPFLEDRECKVSYYRGKSKKTRDWSDFETKRFYKALNTIGPDFTLMQKYFPKRSRLELKNKFKREERLNRTLIDKALNNPSEFDMTQLEKDLALEEEAEEGIEMRFRRIVKHTPKRPRIKSSFLSREMVESDGEPENSHLKSLEMESKRLSEKEKNKKEKEFDFVFHKLLMKESKRTGATLPDISSLQNASKDLDHDVT